MKRCIQPPSGEYLLLITRSQFLKDKRVALRDENACRQLEMATSYGFIWKTFIINHSIRSCASSKTFVNFPNKNVSKVLTIWAFLSLKIYRFSNKLLRSRCQEKDLCNPHSNT